MAVTRALHFSDHVTKRNGGSGDENVLDSSFTRPGSAPIWGGNKGEFRDWTKQCTVVNKMAAASLHFRVFSKCP